MALSDLFDPATYAPIQGDLIDRLRAQYAAAPTNTGAGFPGTPMNANAAAMLPAAPAPQPQNAPIAVGDYQMPRIGSGFLDVYPQHDPQTGETIAPQQAAPAAPPVNPLLKVAQALHSIAQGGSLFGATTGNFDDPMSIKQRQLQQQAQALVNAGMSPQLAQLAVLNPKAGETLIAQKFGPQTLTSLGQGYVADKNGNVRRAYEPDDKFQHVTIKQPDGSEALYSYDPSTGKYTLGPAPAAANTDSGTITGPNGQPIPIPAGVDRKTFVNEVSKANADAATGKMTEGQAKASAFAARMEQAEATLKGLEGEGTSYTGKALDTLPLIGGTAATNSLQSSGYQKYRQAAGNFVTAMLRQESGAAISNSEFSRYEKEMLPQPGDSAGVLAQKRVARAAAIEQMKRAAGPGYRSSAGTAATTNTPDPLGIR